MASLSRFGLFVALCTLIPPAPVHADDPADDPLPQGPKLRLGTTRFRNVWSEAPFALSPDGKTLATMTRAREIAFVDVASGKVARRLPIDTVFQGRVEYLPGGKLLTVETHHGLHVIDLESGRELSRAGFKNFYYRAQATVSADGTRAAVPENNHVLRDEERKPIAVEVWDMAAKKTVCTVKAIQNELVRASLSADGKVLATWGRYRPTKNFRVAGEAQENTVELWDADTGKERSKLVLGGMGDTFDPDGFTLTTTVSPDGKEVAVAVAQAGGVECFNTATGKSVRRLASRGAPVKRLAYSPDGTHLAALGYDGAVQLWDLKAGKRLGVTDSPVGEVEGVVFPEPGRAVAWGMDGRAVAVWEVPSGKRIVAPEGHTKGVTSILFSPDGKTVTTAGADHTIAEWDAATGEMKSAVRLKLPERAQPERRKAGSPPGWGTPDATILSPDGKRVAVAANDSRLHEILVYDRATGTELLGLRTGFGPPGAYSGPRFAPDGTQLFHPLAGLTTRERKEYASAVWNIESGRPVCDIPVLNWSSFPLPFAFSTDGTQLIRLAVTRNAQGENTTLLVCSWNSSTGAKVAEHVISTSPAVIANASWLAVGPDGKTAVVAVSGSDAQERQLFTWDYTTGKLLKEVPLADGFAPSGPVAVSPDGKAFVAVGRIRERFGERTVIRVYDLATTAVVRELVGSGGWVTVLAFSPDGKTLASGSHDTTILLWDLSVLPKPK